MLKQTELTREIHSITGLDLPTAHHALDAAGTELAVLEHQVKVQERKCKRVWSRLYLFQTGSIPEREARCEISPDYIKEVDELERLNELYFPARRRYETLRAGIETGRTLVSYQKKVLEQLGPS